MQSELNVEEVINDRSLKVRMSACSLSACLCELCLLSYFHLTGTMITSHSHFPNLLFKTLNKLDSLATLLGTPVVPLLLHAILQSAPNQTSE